VEGVNILTFKPVRIDGLLELTPDFIPSVANVGLQAIYVREILRRYWKDLSKIPDEAFTDEKRNIYLEQSNQALLEIPEELLKIVLSFDKDGNLVSSVDLSKYGLSIPFIDPKPTATDFLNKKYTVIFPHEQAEGWTPPAPPPAQEETPPPVPEATQPSEEEPPPSPPANRPWLYIAILALATVIGWFLYSRIRGKVK
jgi:hypothetical protein